VFGHASRALYAVWSNPAPGVEPERFREYYEDVHRPDTLAIGHFDRSFRYEALGPCGARYLTLWEAEYPDLEHALERVRKGALALRERGRIWPVQEVVFHQFVFLCEHRGGLADARELTTVQNDWRTQGPLPRVGEPSGYDASYLYEHAGRYLWLGEASGPIDADAWREYASGLPPFGPPIPIFPDATPPAAPDPDAIDPRRAWAVHWKWIS
jgi:hypothetical protein